MGSSGPKPLEEKAKPPPSFSENWKERILIPTLLAGTTGGGVGLVSKHRKAHGLANISATYATNFAIVSGCYCGGQFGAFRYAVIFAVVGTAVDFATIKLRPALSSYKQSIFKDKEKNPGWLKLPEWSPIQVLDEEELAAKKAREKELYAAQSALGKLSKEES